MISRRTVLITGSAIAMSRVTRGFASSAGAASQPSTPVSFEVPPNACDCHTHIFGDPRRFPLAPERTYTPERASIDEHRGLHRALHITRSVVVQPSVYGVDNRCTLDALRQLGTASRGVAVIDETTSESALDEMGRAGVRGVRLNLETAGDTDSAAARRRLQRAVERLRGREWHIQIYTRLSVIEGIQDLVLAAPLPIVFDHFGGAQAQLGVQQPGFPALLTLVRSGKAFVKISAPYLTSSDAPHYRDVAPLARALVAANPRRVLWATNWPHPDSSPIPGRAATAVSPLRQVDDGDLFNQLAIWIPDLEERKAILVDNPARLYGF